MMNTDKRKCHTQFLLGVGECGLAGVIVMCAAVLALTAIMRMFDPIHWGLWVSPKMFLLGVVDNPFEAREILGDNLQLLALALVVPACMAAQEFLQSAKGRIARSWSVRDV